MRQANVFFYLWIVAAVVSTCYTLTWDIKMDWGLLDKNAGENKFLREETVYAFRVSGHFWTFSDELYGKFFFSSNTLAVGTPKIILKLLLKTFSFSSTSDYFHAFEFLILRTLKNARNNAWTSQPCQIFGCFVFPWRHEQREATLSSQCMVYC